MPPGFGLLSNGQIIGQPLATDGPTITRFTVTATNSANNQTSRQFDLLLLPPATVTTPPDYTPQQVIQAYGLNKIILGGGVVGTGAGQTVLIYEQQPGSNFSSSTDQANYDKSDLYKFDNLFNLEQFGDGSTPGQPIFLQLNRTDHPRLPRARTARRRRNRVGVRHRPLRQHHRPSGSDMQTAITTALSGTLPQATLNTLAAGRLSHPSP